MNRVCKNSLDMKCLNSIASDLAYIGFDKNSKSFMYLCHAIFFTAHDYKDLAAVNCNVFTKIANFYNTKPANIEKACRHALDVVYFNGDLLKVNDALGINYLKPYEKPHLTTFICILAEKYIIRYNKLKLLRQRKIKTMQKTLKLDKVLNPSKIFLIKEKTHQLSL